MVIRNFGITDKLARRLFPSAQDPLRVITKIRECLFKKGILTREVLIFSLATLKVENPLLNCSREQGTPEYFKRTYKGTLGPGDFPKWAGRGLSQLTGEFNYKLMASLTGRPDLLTNPDLLLDLDFSVEVFCEFINDPYYLNHLYKEARIRYNGGYNGMEEFEKAVKEFSKALA